ncbi:MAG: fibrobacter succinogenes major paralogous domain-containing protein [Chitinispirillales bacterium]|jgi:uncharacterized protein (TIGR02145 family)|nr:fibrobacter succinogenes major paralogous domain-containing protein [Chitinispirillales bacterium]
MGIEKTLFLIVAAAAFTLAAGDGAGFTDSRDGRKYRTVAIGYKTWMAENLNFKADSSWCPANNESNCEQYGRLYRFDAARKVCPKGWHLPDTAEWRALVKAAGGSAEGGKLKSKTGWNVWLDKKEARQSGNGNDLFGFSALPGGCRLPNQNSSYDFGRYGYWWSKTAGDDKDYAYSRHIGNENAYAFEGYDNKRYGFSVRCVNDAASKTAAPPPSAPTPQWAAGASSFTDSRNGQKYRAVKIGNQTWMAENLNYKTDSSWCNGNNESNCKQYGRLYAWDAAKTACPGGWHLPDTAEWEAMIQTAGGKTVAGKKLKSERGWQVVSSQGDGTDDYGFSALPGGFRNEPGDFSGIGYYGSWWSATESRKAAHHWHMNYLGGSVSEKEQSKGNGYAVRCVKN